jgi:hypothetical protein
MATRPTNMADFATEGQMPAMTPAMAGGGFDLGSLVNLAITAPFLMQLLPKELKDKVLGKAKQMGKTIPSGTPEAVPSAMPEDAAFTVRRRGAMRSADEMAEALGGRKRPKGFVGPPAPSPAMVAANAQRGFVGPPAPTPTMVAESTQNRIANEFKGAASPVPYAEDAKRLSAEAQAAAAKEAKRVAASQLDEAVTAASSGLSEQGKRALTRQAAKLQAKGVAGKALETRLSSAAASLAKNKGNLAKGFKLSKGSIIPKTAKFSKLGVAAAAIPAALALNMILGEAGLEFFGTGGKRQREMDSLQNEMSRPPVPDPRDALARAQLMDVVNERQSLQSASQARFEARARAKQQAMMQQIQQQAMLAAGERFL